MNLEEDLEEEDMKCGSCGKKIKDNKNACWIRITDPDGGKIIENNLCESCAYDISRKVEKYR